MEEEKVRKPLLLSSLSATKPKPPRSSFLSEAQVLSLLAALVFACFYAGFAAYNLRDRQRRRPPCQAPAERAAWLIRCYLVSGAGAVGAARALLRRLLWCSAPQAAAAAALALLARGRSRRGLGFRAAALVALAATAASHWMYVRLLLRLLRVDGSGDLFLALETACVVAAAALDLLGIMAFVLGGDK